MLLKLTRWTKKTIGSSKDYLGIVNWIVMYRPDKVCINRADNNEGRLSRQCTSTNIEAVIMTTR